MSRQLFQFFGLQENPFRMAPYPSYLLVNRKTQSILDDLADGIQAGKSLLVLTGEAGTGKTTLVKRLMEWLKLQGIQAAFIFNSRLEPTELFEMILDGYGALNNRQLRGNPRQRLNQWLIEQNAAGVRPVLIIDEAQGLPPATLEEVRLLLNQEFMGEKVIQIVLSGQPELDETLRRPEFRHLRQRIELRRNTIAFDRDESRGYIQKRIDVAGAQGKSVFPEEAAEAVYFYAHGVPRVMNLLCEHGLRRAFERGAQCVAPEMVDEVARELQFEEYRPVVKCESAREIIGHVPEQRSQSAHREETSPEPPPPTEIAALEPLVVGLDAPQQSPVPQKKVESGPSEELHVLEPIQLATPIERPAQPQSVASNLEAPSLVEDPESTALCVVGPIEVQMRDQTSLSKNGVTTMVRTEAPARHWIQPRRGTLELRLTLSIASVFNQAWQRWQDRYAALGRWLCGPMPFGHRRARRAFDRPSAAA